MKFWLAAALVMVFVGAGFGYYRVQAEFGREGQLVAPAADDGSAGTPAQLTKAVDTGNAEPAGDGAKVLVVNGELHNFGAMQHGGTLKHVFEFKNVGTAPLKLWKRGSSCQCTFPTLKDGEEEIWVQPGETTNIELQWTAKSTEPQFNQHAEIGTNDPARPAVRVAVEGIVQEAVYPTPRSFEFNEVSFREPVTRVVHVLDTRNAGLEIAKHRWSDPAIAEHFEVTHRKLEADEAARFKLAASVVELSVTLKPGYPTNAINQTLIISTNAQDAVELEVPVNGTIGRDVSLIGGRNFRRRESVLRMGAVQRSEGGRESLAVLVKGADRENIEVKVKEVDPEGILHVTVGPPKDPTAKVVILPVTVEVKPGAEPISRMGNQLGPAGRVLLETNHPQVKELVFEVQFAVN